MSGTDDLFETISGYLTVRLGQASLSPGETVILVATATIGGTRVRTQSARLAVP